MNKTYIIGLSGGPDSVYLLHFLMKQSKDQPLTLIAAHLDHEWRKDSYKDAEFCRDLCAKFNIKFISKKASDLSIQVKHNGSQEEVGRKLRRYFFEKLAQKYNADAIVLGHHADDQIETFFIRLIRGTTVQGLSCIKEKNGLYWRPFLYQKKEAIITWLKKHNINYLNDPSNDSPAHLRNIIRKTIIPAFKSSDVRAEKNFTRTLQHIQNAEQFLQKHTEETFALLWQETEGLEFRKLLNLDHYIQKRVIQYWLAKKGVKHTLTNTFLEEIIRFLKNPHGGSHQITNEWKLTKKQNKAFIIKKII